MRHISRPIKLTKLDEQTFNGMSQVLKAATAYMEPSAAKTVAVLAKIMELRNTLAYMNQSQPLQACSIGGHRPDTQEMLQDLRKYCDGAEAQSIDRILNMMKMGKFYEKFKALENSPEFRTMQNALSHTGNTGDNQAQAQDLLSKIPPELLKNFNPEMLNNITPEMINQVMNAARQSGFIDNAGPLDQNIIEKTDNSQLIEQLKSMLTPQQRQMFEALQRSVK